MSLLYSVLFLYCFCVVSFSLFFLFFSFLFLHWPIVMPLTPPVWCRFGSVCLWTDSPLSNGANVLLCDQNTVSWNWASDSKRRKQTGSKSDPSVDERMYFSLWWWRCTEGMKKGKKEAGRKERRKDWRGRMSWGWSQEIGGWHPCWSLPPTCPLCPMLRVWCCKYLTEMNE